MKHKFVFIFILLFLMLSNIYCIDGILIPYKEQYIISQISAPVTKLNILEGQKISKGDLICTLDTTDLHIKINKAEIDLLQTKSTISQTASNIDILTIKHNNLVKDLKLAYEMYKQNGISKAEYNEKKIAVKLSKLNINMLKDKLELYKHTLKYQQSNLEKLYEKIKNKNTLSPIDGVIKKIFINEGQYISENTKITSIIDMSKLIAEFNINVNKVTNYKINRKIVIFVPLLNKKFYGIIHSIFPEYDSVTKTVKIWAVISNYKNKLKPGMIIQID